MRIGLKAKSKNQIGYTPDWIKVSFSENSQNIDLVFDIQGEISYTTNTLNCSIKGELIPWTIWKDGEEIDISEKANIQEEISINLLKILRKSTDFEVGIYPIDDSVENYPLAKEDIVKNGIGFIEVYLPQQDEFKSVNFNFQTELN